MSNFERSILGIIDPTIKVDQIAIEDFESKEAVQNTSSAVQEGSHFKQSSKQGAYIPLIQINSIKLDLDEIQYFSLSLNDKIPKVSVSIVDNNNKFLLQFPIDGDVISVYLRPPDADNQKPIRIDFDIEFIDSDPNEKIYTFYGLMKIPGFFNEKIKAFRQDTTFNHISTVCEDVGLGFASNETITDDTMTRICAYETYETFVKDMLATVYLNDDSFFDWYIDPYYYLCLVNVNKQFSLEDKTEEINISTSEPVSGIKQQEDAEDSIKGSLVLTNQTERAGTNVFIESFSLQNNAGNVWLNNGYKKYAQWFEISRNESTIEESFVDPLTTKSAENNYILLKGRKDDKDFYKTQSKYKWLGKQSTVVEGGNVHSNYSFAKVLNYHNLQECTKTVLKVYLAGMNFYIYKYMRIPVLIYQPGDNAKNAEQLKQRDKDLGETQTKDSSKDVQTAFNRKEDKSNETDMPIEKDQIKNEFLSGYYIVGNIEYEYFQNGSIKQVLTLIRREWPIPAKQKDQ